MAYIYPEQTPAWDTDTSPPEYSHQLIPLLLATQVTCSVCGIADFSQHARTHKFPTSVPSSASTDKLVHHAPLPCLWE